MKIVKCGKIDQNDYCVVKIKYKTSFNTIIYQYELYVDVTNDERLIKWLQIHKDDEQSNYCKGVSKGVVAIGMNGKPRTKFRNKTFARFILNSSNSVEIMNSIKQSIDMFYRFKMICDLEGI